MPFKYNGAFIPFARGLRTEMTKQEKHLWYDYLSAYPLRFQCQKTIGNYIADFYCFKARLIVEIDGSQHYTKDGMNYDEQRTKALNALGLAVLRFTNYEVDSNFEGVCMMIDCKVKEKVR